MMWRHDDYIRDKYILLEEGMVKQLINNGTKGVVEVVKVKPGTFSSMNTLIASWTIFVFKDYRSTLRSHATFPRWRKTIHNIEILTSYC